MTYRTLIFIFFWSIISYNCTCTKAYGQNYTFPIAFRECRPLITHDTITVTFVGDIMLHGRQLRHALLPNADPTDAQSYNFSNAFKHIREDIKNADIAVANMEFPVGIPPYSGYPLFSAPESIIWEAQNTGFNLFLLANNHILDKGKKGFSNTIELYKKNNANFIGAYTSKEEQQLQYPKIIRVKDVKIAFLNFTYGTNGFPIPKEYAVNTIDTTHIKESIEKAHKSGADIIIAAPHWGNEYQSNANSGQEQLAQFMIKNGVSAIIGSHPHVTQNGYITNNNTVFYSLGNYISNQSNPPHTQLGLMVTIKIVKNLINNECYIWDTQYQYLWCFRAGEYLKDYTVVKVKDIIDKKIPLLDSAMAKKAIDTYNRVNKNNPIKNYKQIYTNGRKENRTN